MINTGKHLQRRTFLRGLGTAMALPFLDAMVPATARANRLAKGLAPRRLAFAYVPNGVIMEAFRPAGVGENFEITRVLEPIAAYKKDMLVFSGLTHNNGRALGDGPGDHARAAASYLTGVHPKKTAGADIKNGVSVDQVAAMALGDQTRFASLELGTEPGRLAGNCDSGYSCAYSNSISWRGPTSPNPPEINPRLVFERLFGAADEPSDPALRARMKSYKKSILDFVQDDTKALMGTLGPTDQRKMDEYLYAVRDIEKRIETAEKNGETEIVPDIERPAGVPADFAEHVKLMYDMMTIAYQADLTRVTTFMYGREGSNRTYRPIGVPGAHHGLTHHRGDEEKIEDITKINVHHMELFAYFLDRLASVQEGDNRLLDNMMVVYGSGISDGNKHWHHDLPIVMVGGGGGTIRSGRHVSYSGETPMTNLYLSLLDRAGVPSETLGDSSGKLEHLTDL
ncbi:MAG: DUF1552 domain-containing protein [Acidobacteria bacterium]|nr:DUF1552 domain-containing protein [Acidobacteriota bacterium]